MNEFRNGITALTELMKDSILATPNRSDGHQSIKQAATGRAWLAAVVALSI